MQSATVVLLMLQAGLSVRQLHLPHGVLSGISRRVSSLFFGSHTLEVQESRKVAIAERTKSSKDASVFLLTNANLQKWHIDSSSEQVTQFLNH